MPNVASDPVVQRPLRPEPVSGRAGAPAGEPRDAFETLLDSAPAEAPRALRADRPRASARRDQAGPVEQQNAPRAEARHARATAQRPTADANSEKPVTPDTQAKDGQLSSPDQPGNAEASTGLPAVPPAEMFAALAAATVKAEGDATPAEGEADAAPVKAEDAVIVASDTAPEGADDASLLAANDAQAVAAPSPIVAAVPILAPVSPLPVSDPAGELADIVPVVPQASPPADTPEGATIDAAAKPVVASQAAADAPAVPVNGAPVAPDAAANMPAADPVNRAPAAPQPAAAAPETVKANGAPADQPAEAPKAAAPAETLEAQTLVRPNGKPDATAKPRADQPARVTQPEAVARSTAEATPAAPIAPAAAEQPAPTPGAVHHAQAQLDHASVPARSLQAEVRGDVAPPPVPSPQLGASAPVLPLNLATPVTLPTMFPITALRVDTADAAVPLAGLAVEIVARSHDGLRRFEIRLDPPELGRIDVRLDVDHGGKVSSRLVVERADTLDLLRRDAHQLERALQQAGLNTEGGLEFSLRDQRFANREQAPGDGAAISRLIVPDDEPAAAEAARRGYGRLVGLGGGVDIRV